MNSSWSSELYPSGLKPYKPAKRGGWGVGGAFAIQVCRLFQLQTASFFFSSIIEDVQHFKVFFHVAHTFVQKQPHRLMLPRLLP